MLGVDLYNFSHFKPFQPNFDRLSLTPGIATQTNSLSSGNQGTDPFTRIQKVLNHRLSEQLGSPARTLPFNAQNSAFDAEEVANNVLGMVQNRLKQAEAEGADQEQLQLMREQAKSGIEQGIDEARDLLEGMNMLSDSVEAGIGRLQELLSEGLAPDLESDDQVVDGAQLIQVAHRFEQTAESSFELQIKTQDGDQINVQFSQLDKQQDLLSYRQTGNSEALNTSHIETSSSRFELSVEGELDEEELAAITDLAQDIQQVSEDFFDGNVQAAFEQGMQLGFDTEQITGFALELQYSQSSVATTRYREISGLEQTDGFKIPGLDQVSGLLEQMKGVFEQAEGLFEQTERTASDMLKGFMTHHPKAGEFSDLLNRHGNDEIKDVVEGLVGQVTEDHDE